MTSHLTTVTDPAAVRAAKRAFARGTLPVTEAWFAEVESAHGLPRTPIPIVRVDPRKRPDVRDLLRVQRLEGDGEVETRWRIAMPGPPDAWQAVLEAEVRRPVRCAFALRFRLRDHAPALLRVAEGGLLGIVAAPAKTRRAGHPDGPALLIACVREGLVEALALYAALSLVSPARTGR